MKCKFKDFIEKSHEIENGIFEHTTYSFMNDYNNNWENIDISLLTLYGQREFDVYGETFEKTYINFTKLWDGYLKMNGYNWQRIFDTMKTTYEPLENYDKRSEIITTYNGKEKEQTTQNDTTNNSITQTVVEDADDTTTNTSTNTISGTNNVTNQNGKQKNVVLNENTTYDTNTFFDTNRQTTNNDAFTNTENVTNNSTNENESETKNERESTITTTSSNINDLDSVVNNVKEFENRNDTVVERTHGNIGVTTSTKMLEDEYNLRQKLEFYMNLFTKFIYTYSY